VLVVQTLLNKNAHIVESIGRVPQDGNLDESTTRAILAFQRDVVRLASPDGRVDPNGRTFRILTGDAPHGATVAFVQLPGNAADYYCYANHDRQWGTPATIQSARNLAAAMFRQGIVVGFGEISFANGGRMPPHKSHRRGTDVDIRPQRKDGARSPVNIRMAEYSHDNTRLVVQELQKDDNLELILFNDRKIEGVRFWEGHENHLHVRFKE
jgi:murein endopeptidase